MTFKDRAEAGRALADALASSSPSPGAA